MPLGQYTYHYGHCYNVHHHNGGPTQCGGHICPQLLRSLQQCTPSHRRSSQITATAYAPRLCLKIEYKSDHWASLGMSHISCLSPPLERRPSFTLLPYHIALAHPHTNFIHQCIVDKKILSEPLIDVARAARQRSLKTANPYAMVG